MAWFSKTKLFLITLFLSCKSKENIIIVIDQISGTHKEINFKFNEKVKVSDFLEQLVIEDSLQPFPVSIENVYINEKLVKNYNESLFLYHNSLDT